VLNSLSPCASRNSCRVAAEKKNPLNPRISHELSLQSRTSRKRIEVHRLASPAFFHKTTLRGRCGRRSLGRSVRLSSPSKNKHPCETGSRSTGNLQWTQRRRRRTVTTTTSCWIDGENCDLCEAFPLLLLLVAAVIFALLSSSSSSSSAKP
jgi:hypothetical protein